MSQHRHHVPEMGRTLVWSLAVTTAFVVVETVVGLRSGSLALVSDAGHNFTDAFGLALAGAGYYFQARPGDQRKTFGYQRTSVLAAFFNALTLGVLAAWLFWESYQRLQHPTDVASLPMLVVAAVGLVLNLSIARALDGHAQDLNLRAAWVHMLGDAASCGGIVVGALIIYFTGWVAIDPILSLFIAAAIVWTAWDIFMDSLNILLEGLPKGLKLTDVTAALGGVTGVLEVHDLHIWNLGSEDRALSCHVLIDDVPLSESESILRDLNQVLCRQFSICHTTIQFEHARCEAAGASCTAVNHHHH